MSKRKELMICKEPPIIYALYGSVCLSIVLKERTENINNWFYNHFIHLYYNERIRPDGQYDHFIQFVTFKDNSLNEILKTVIVTEKNKKGIDKDNVIEQIKQWIDEGYYVHSYVDVSEIPSNIMEEKIAHSVFLYGYDLDRKEFLQLDFNPTGKFGEIRTKFSDYIRAFQSGYAREDLKKKGYAEEYYFRLYKLMDFDCTMYLEFIKREVNLYLNSDSRVLSNKTICAGKNNTHFGISVTQCLKEYISKIHSLEKMLDIRAFRAFWEHKKIMLERFQYMHERGLIQDVIIIEKYGVIEYLANNLRFLGMKYNMKKSGEIVKQMLKILNDINNKEHTALEEFLNSK